MLAGDVRPTTCWPPCWPTTCGPAGARPSAARSPWSSRACRAPAAGPGLLAELRRPRGPGRPGGHLRGARAWASRPSSRPSAPRSPAAGHRVGVLAVDPSACAPAARCSATRPGWPRLAVDPHAFIRPSPSAGHPRRRRPGDHPGDAGARGGGLRRGAGRDGRGRPVRDRPWPAWSTRSCFLTLARTGDQLQGIKKGILEIADVIAVNKADGDREGEARLRGARAGGALRLVHWARAWAPPVLTCSGLTGTGGRRRVGAGARPPRAPRRGRPRRQARRAAAGLHLGAGPRRARPAAAPLRRAYGGSGRRCATSVLGGELTARAAADLSWPPTTHAVTMGSRRAGELTFPGHVQRTAALVARRGRGRQVRRRARRDLRRDLHAHPELSWHEERTTDLVAKRLPEAGLAAAPALAQRADRRHRRRAARVVALRADLDALPVDDRPTIPGPARSPGSPTRAATTCTPPRCSAPGLALAERARDRAAARAGPAGLPAGRGDDARRRAARDREPVPSTASSRIFCLHCDPSLDVGQVGLREGPLTGAADRLEVALRGKGGHTSRPHLTEDLTFALAKLVTELPAVLSRRLDPRAGVSVVWGMVRAGSAHQRDPRPRATVGGTVRMLDAVAWADAEQLVRDTIVSRSSRPTACTAEVDLRPRRPARRQRPGPARHRWPRPSGGARGPRGGCRPRRASAARTSPGTSTRVPGAMGRLGHPHARRTDLRPPPGRPAGRRARDRPRGQGPGLDGADGRSRPAESASEVRSRNRAHRGQSSARSAVNRRSLVWYLEQDRAERHVPDGATSRVWPQQQEPLCASRLQDRRRPWVLQSTARSPGAPSPTASAASGQPSRHPARQQCLHRKSQGLHGARHRWRRRPLVQPVVMGRPPGRQQGEPEHQDLLRAVVSRRTTTRPT